MNAQFVIDVALVAFVVGGVVGHVIGHKRGRDAQWVDDFIEQGRRERARHGRDGKFIAIKGKESRT